MTRVLVTGCRGQIGVELLRARWPAGTEVVGLDRRGLDITHADDVRAAVAGFDLVVNAAGYTAVDRAESERDAAFAVNADGAAHLAAACAAHDIPLVQFSTDYVFDGSTDGWYAEDDGIAPLGVYGASKAAGETAVRQLAPRHLIVRTAWVYADHGVNFVRTMLRLAEERDELRVVANQWGCPTAADNVAAAVVAMATQAMRPDFAAWGTYHWCGGGGTSWYGLAEAIFLQRQAATGRHVRLKPISADQYPTQARRPRNSRLGCAKACRTFGLVQRPWRDSLRPVLDALLASQREVAA